MLPFQSKKKILLNEKCLREQINKESAVRIGHLESSKDNAYIFRSVGRTFSL